jgi:hypothetical protein
MTEEKKPRKPIHVVKKDKSPDAPLLQDQHLRGLEVAQQKVDDLSVHLPHDIDSFVIAEQDDDEIRFYLGVSVSF